MIYVPTWFLVSFFVGFYGVPSIFIALKCLYWSKKSRTEIGYWKQWMFLFATTLFFIKGVFSNSLIRRYYFYFTENYNIIYYINGFLSKSDIYANVYLYASDFLLRFLISFIIIGLLCFNGEFISRGKYWLAKLKGKQPKEQDYAPPLKKIPFSAIFFTSFAIASLIFFEAVGPIHWLLLFSHPYTILFPIILTLNFVVGTILKIFLTALKKLK